MSCHPQHADTCPYGCVRVSGVCAIIDQKSIYCYIWLVLRYRLSVSLIYYHPMIFFRSFLPPLSPCLYLPHSPLFLNRQRKVPFVFIKVYQAPFVFCSCIHLSILKSAPGRRWCHRWRCSFAIQKSPTRDPNKGIHCKPTALLSAASPRRKTWCHGNKQMLSASTYVRTKGQNRKNTDKIAI